LNLNFDSYFDLNFNSGTAVSCHNTTCPAECVYLEEKCEEGKKSYEIAIHDVDFEVCEKWLDDKLTAT